MLDSLFSVRIDDKGRITLPKKFRVQMGQKIIIARGLENCLLIFPMEAFKKQDFQTFLIVQELKIDNQGRLTIPLVLRQIADLRKEVVILGKGNCLQIWNKEIWLKSIKENVVANATLKDWEAFCQNYERRLEKISITGWEVFLEKASKKLQSDVAEELTPILTEFSSQLNKCDILMNALILILIKKHIINPKEINELQKEIEEKIRLSIH